MLRSVMFKYLASHLFFTLLVVVLVGHVFIAQVSFIGDVGFGQKKVAKSYSFLVTKSSSDFIQLFW